MAVEIGADVKIIDIQTGKLTRQGLLIFQQLALAGDAVAEVADVGGTYSQSEVQAIVDAVNDLRTSLANAGKLNT